MYANGRSNSGPVYGIYIYAHGVVNRSCQQLLDDVIITIIIRYPFRGAAVIIL